MPDCFPTLEIEFHFRGCVDVGPAEAAAAFSKQRLREFPRPADEVRHAMVAKEPQVAMSNKLGQSGNIL